jgi:hypothetical protein
MNLRLPFATTGSPKPKYREVFEFNGAVRSPVGTPLADLWPLGAPLPYWPAISLFNRENTGKKTRIHENSWKCHWNSGVNSTG